VNDESDLALSGGPDAAARVALACARLGPSERELLERVLARGGRATLEDAGADPAAIARLERLLGWFGFEAELRAGPQARVVIARDVLELVASSVAGVPALRRRPVRFLSLEARVSALEPEEHADLAELARPGRIRERARAAGEGVFLLVGELVRRGGLAPLVSLPRELREIALAADAPLERALLGAVGRLEGRGAGLDLDRPFAVLAREVYRALVLDEGRPPERAAARPLVAGALLGVFPALALAREGELRETKRGVLAQRSREHLETILSGRSRSLGRAEDEPTLFARALVEAGLLERRPDGQLAPGPLVEPFARGGLREQVEILLGGWERATPVPGGPAPGVAAKLASLVREELLAIEGPVPPELPARLAVYRFLERSVAGVPAPVEPDALELEDAVSLAWAIAVPAAEAVGLIAVEPDPCGSPDWLRPTELQLALRGDARVLERCLILSADGEAVVLPVAGAPLAALLLSRVAERASAGEVLRFRLTPASVRRGELRADELESLLARLSELARGEVPESFARTLRDAGGSAVRARTSVLRVLDVPRVAAADRAARILGDSVLDRLTPTLLVLREPLSAAQRRALAKEGVFVDP
jgi:hypothetical protein